MSENELIAYRSINAQLVKCNVKLKDEKHLLEAEKNELWRALLEVRTELLETKKENSILKEVLKNQNKQNKMMIEVLLNANNNFQKLFPNDLPSFESVGSSVSSTEDKTQSYAQKRTTSERRSSKENSGTPKINRRTSSKHVRTSLQTISPTAKKKVSMDLPKRKLSDYDDDDEQQPSSSDMDISNTHQTSLVNESIAEEDEEQDKENQEPAIVFHPNNENNSEEQYLKLSTLVEERSSQFSSIEPVPFERTMDIEMTSEEVSMLEEDSRVDEDSMVDYTVERLAFNGVENRYI